MRLENIPKVKTFSKADFVRDYVRPQKPVVIERLIEDWPAFEKWNLQYIRDIAGDKEVPLYDDRPISSEFKFNEPNEYKRKGKLADHLLRKGYESSLVFDSIQEIL